MSRTTPRRDSYGHRLDSAPMPPEEALWSLPLEQQILGSIMVDPWESLALLEQVNFDAADLYRDAHRHLYDLLCRMAESGTPPLEMAVLSRIMESSSADLYGGASYVSHLTLSTSSTRLRHTVLQVQRYAVRRRLLRTLMDGIQALTDGTDPAEIQASTTADLSSIPLPGGAADRLVTFSELADSVPQSSNNSEAADPTWSTQMPALDQILGGGMTPGRLYVIGGRPKHGKSTLALNLLAGLSREGHRSHMVSLEMTSIKRGTGADGKPVLVARDLAKKLVALTSGVNSRRVALSPERLGETDYRRMIRGAMEVHDWKGTIDDTPGRTIDQIRAQARRVKAQHPDLHVLVVDHAGLVRGTPGQTKRDVMSAVSTGLKECAKELDIVVILAAQINRDAAAKEFPAVDNLKESGTLEEDADAVLLVLNPELAKMSPAAPSLWVSVAVNRHGPHGDLWLDFEPTTGLIGEPIPNPIPAAPSRSRGRNRGGAAWAEED